MKYILSAVKLIIIVALVLFAVFNRGEVDITVIPDHIVYRTFLFVPILGALAVGGIAMTLVFVRERMRMSKSMKIMRKKLKETEDELSKLHNLPLLQDYSDK